MKVSIVSIAKNEREFEPLKKALKKQTLKNFEFVYSTKKGIPQAWNDAISRAKGEIIITVDSDVKILSNKWLEEMVNAIKKYNKNDPKRRTIIKGIEVTTQPWTWCNIAFYADVLKNNKVDESYPIAEDTEIFTRLKKLGYRGLELPIAPVLHERDEDKILKRSFTYGILNTKINLKYGSQGFKDEKKKGSSVFKREISAIASRILYLLGITAGFVTYKLTSGNNMKKIDWRKEQKEAYDEIVKRSKSPTGHTILYRKKSLETLNKIIPKKGKILDLGCGTGHYAEIFNNREWEAGVDISPKSIKVAKKFYRKAKAADVTKHIPFSDSLFDYVFALSIFHHINQGIPEALKEVKRVLKPNGEVIVIDHDARNTHERNITSGPLSLTPTSTERALHPDEMTKFLKEAGFVIKKTSLLHLEGDQQALIPPLIVRMIKVPLMWFLDMFGENRKYPGEFLIIAKNRK